MLVRTKTDKPGHIALLTDFGPHSLYTGIMKGVMAAINKRVRVIDLAHDIPAHDIETAGFLLAKSFHYFPRHTVFCAVVDPGVGSNRKPLLLKTRRYYFVGPDNGILSLAAYEDGIREIIELTNEKYFLDDLSSTFQGRDIFAPVSAFLTKGVKTKKFGRSLSRIHKIRLPRIVRSGDILRGSVLYVDHFGNLVTTITRQDLDDFLTGRPFRASLKNCRNITAFYNCYAGAPEDQPFFIEGSFSLMEISVKNKNARQKLGAQKGDPVIVTRKR